MLANKSLEPVASISHGESFHAEEDELKPWLQCMMSIPDSTRYKPRRCSASRKCSPCKIGPEIFGLTSELLIAAPAYSRVHFREQATKSFPRVESF